MPAKPALRTELLFYMSFLAAAALLVGVATLLLATSFAPERTFVLVMLMIALEVGVFIVFGRYLVNRLVLWPLERVVATADAVADGDLGRRAPEAETRDFATLAERLNRMTDHLLDAQGQLVRSEKLASIGRLAAGIAHEVGNPLGAIGTYVEVLRRRGADPEVVTGVTRELERLDRIVRGLLDYARPQEEALARLGLRVAPHLTEAGERSPAGRIPSSSRNSPRAHRLRGRPAGRAAVRGGFGSRSPPRGPSEGLRPVLHDEAAGSRHGARPGHRRPRGGRNGRGGVGGYGARRGGGVQDVLP